MESLTPSPLHLSAQSWSAPVTVATDPFLPSHVSYRGRVQRAQARGRQGDDHLHEGAHAVVQGPEEAAPEVRLPGTASVRRAQAVARAASRAGC